MTACSRHNAIDQDPAPNVLNVGAELNDANHCIHRRYGWAANSYAAFSAIMENVEDPFPCSFARTAHRQGALRFLLADSPEVEQDRCRVRTGLSTYLADLKTGPPNTTAALLDVLVILFRPHVPALSVEAYHAQAWSVMQDWIDQDPQPWPADTPRNPDQPFWSLCFAGVQLFVNVSSPAHRKRRSRNLGPSLALVTQPRASFDLIGGAHHQGQAVRENIRRQMASFDGQSAPAELGTYHRGDLEWVQYVLQETNGRRRDTCPLTVDDRRSW